MRLSSKCSNAQPFPIPYPLIGISSRSPNSSKVTVCGGGVNGHVRGTQPWYLYAYIAMAPQRYNNESQSESESIADLLNNLDS